MIIFGRIAGFTGHWGALRQTSRLARRAAPVARRRRGRRGSGRGRGTSVLRAVNHRSPRLQGRPGATLNAPCSSVIHHDWPLMSHQASTAPHCRHVAIGRRRQAAAPEGAAETYFAWIKRPDSDPSAVWPSPIVGCRAPHHQGAGADGDVEAASSRAHFLSTMRSGSAGRSNSTVV